MDRSEAGHNVNETADATEGGGSSLGLGHVKQVLSIKMEKPDAHYTSIEPLGKGSFGEVHSATDALLGRDVAIKSLKEQFRNEEEVVDRFLKEARGTSQLEHPNIMPVHEMGVSDELGIYFTMKKIEGDNLKEILDHLEADTSFYKKKYPQAVLLEIFLSVCNGVAFAHSKGVIHRDLKPANIMIGEYGEVLVLDWGLVKQLDAEEGTRGGVQLRMEEFDVGSQTLDGAISGTPNYMSPEQAEGRIDDIDFQSDVYSLGAILYHMLAHRPPFEKTQLRKLLENVKLGRFEPPRKRRPDLRIPHEMEAVCLKAMARFPVNRYRSVERFAEDIRNFIGHREVSAYKAPRLVRYWKTCRRNPIKSSVAAAVLAASVLSFSIQRAVQYGIYKDSVRKATVSRLEGNRLVAEATVLFADLQTVCLESEFKAKSPREVDLEHALELCQGEIETEYTVAISDYVGVPDAYRFKRDVIEGYTDIMTNRIALALDLGTHADAQKWKNVVEKELTTAGRLTPDISERLAMVQRRIDGCGTLTITAPESMQDVIVFATKAIGERIFLDQDTAIAHSKPPIFVEIVKTGSYVAMATLADGGIMSYPLHVGHGESKTVELELPGVVPEGMVFVPAGPFFSGGDDSRFYRRHEHTLPSFFIKKHEVTVAEYLEFWKGLDDRNLREAYRSRIRFGRNEREFHNAWNNDGELEDPRLGLDLPVVGIPLDAAKAFCKWKSGQAGFAVRLPTAEEWEKAARGVDGRRYVWGNGFLPSLALTKKNEKGKAAYPLWAPPGTFPYDNSVYNVRDMAGNVREMTSTLLPGSDEFHQLKGGSASTPENFLPCSNSSDTPVVPSDVGFRYVMDMPVEQ